MVLIYFVRHGQTEYNAKGIIQGHIDTSLNDTGRNEAALLAEHIKDVPFVEAWSSSLARAKETAQILVDKHPGLVVQTDPGLKERDLGALSGQRWTPGTVLPSDVEGSAPFRRRVGEWLQSFLAAHVPDQPGAPDPSATILVVSHGAYLSALLGSLLSQPISFVPDQGVDAKKHCLNTCVMRVQADYDEVAGMWRGTILSWGEVDHLGDQAKDIGVADDLRQSFRMATAKLSQ